MSTRIGRVLVLLALVGVTALVLSPVLENELTNWDDDHYIQENPLIRDLSFEGVGRIFTEPHQNLYKPLVFLTYALEYRFFGDDPFIYHFNNLILHLFNCLLVFWLIFLLGRRTRSAFLTALLFGIHPLHVESVAWAAERKDMLYAFFFLSALIAYLFYSGKKNLWLYGASLCFFILSLLSKPMGIILPFVLVLLDGFRGRKINAGVFKDKTLFFLTAFFFGVFTVYFYEKSPASDVVFKMTAWDHLAGGGYAVFFYLAKLFFPVNLSCLYAHPLDQGGSAETFYWLSPFIASFIALVLFYVRKYSPVFVFGGLFFAVTILPALQLVPFSPAVGPSIVADRYTYVPSIGIFYIVSECFGRGMERLGEKGLFKALAVILGMGALFALSATSWQRCHVWRDSVTLWSDAVRKNQSSPVVFNSRGYAYLKRRELQKAVLDFDRALAVDPHYAKAYSNRGIAFGLARDFDKAIADFERAVSENPRSAKYRHNLRVARFQQLRDSQRTVSAKTAVLKEEE